MNIPVEDLPEGWMLTHLIRLGEDDWQVNLRGEDHVVVATGDSPKIALDNAVEKIFLGDFAPLWRPKEDLLKVPKVDLRNFLENLGLATPLNIPRRKGL